LGTKRCQERCPCPFAAPLLCDASVGAGRELASNSGQPRPQESDRHRHLYAPDQSLPDPAPEATRKLHGRPLTQGLRCTDPRQREGRRRPPSVFTNCWSNTGRSIYGDLARPCRGGNVRCSDASCAAAPRRWAGSSSPARSVAPATIAIIPATTALVHSAARPMPINGWLASSHVCCCRSTISW